MDVTIAQIDRFLSMNEELTRVKSFRNWPHYENSNCSVAKMAEAGFFHCPTEAEPDAVQCFVCLKELDGWEDDDDPWQEHRSHSQECSFAKIGKMEKNLTIADIFVVESDRHVNLIKYNTQKKIKQIKYEAEEIKKNLRQMV